MNRVDHNTKPENRRASGRTRGGVKLRRIHCSSRLPAPARLHRGRRGLFPGLIHRSESAVLPGWAITALGAPWRDRRASLRLRPNRAAMSTRELSTALAHRFLRYQGSRRCSSLYRRHALRRSRRVLRRHSRLAVVSRIAEIVFALPLMLAAIVLMAVPPHAGFPND